MNNIFENAYFDKSYKTRDGKKAIYLFSSGCGVYCITENFRNKIRYYHFNGIPYDFEFSKYRGEDIISEWQEEINEKELDKLAEESAKKVYTGFMQTIGIWISGFKVGYRQR